MTDCRKYKIETVRKNINFKDIPVMSVNIKYPVFEAGTDSKNEQGFVSKINRFYADSAEKYMSYLNGKYVKKIASMYERNGSVRTAFVMNCTVTYCSSDYISVFADISSFDGKNTKTHRFSQLWSAQKSAILPPSKVFSTDTRTKRYIKQTIMEIAEKNLGKRDFSYFDNYKSIIEKRLDPANFYIVPNGIAFFYDKGMLSASSQVCVFVMSKEDLPLKIDF